MQPLTDQYVAAAVTGNEDEALDALDAMLEMLFWLGEGDNSLVERLKTCYNVLEPTDETVKEIVARYVLAMNRAVETVTP